VTSGLPPSVTLFRIASDAPEYSAEDLSGKGAENTGGRWNRKGTPLLYTSRSRALACLETVVHFDAQELPLNRYLVEIRVPVAAWDQRAIMTSPPPVGWDAEPPGLVSLDWGATWVAGNASLLAEVPSVIVPEESNVLVNPRHPDVASLSAAKLRKWTYDARFVRRR
jgi:RES domain-containing protein